MTITKDFLPRSFRIDQLVKSAAVTAVLSTACFLPIAANAQSTTPMSATTDNGMSQSAPMTSPTLDSNYDAGPQPGIDYRILSNPSYNYAQIRRAQAYGLSNDQIGRAIGIADQAHVSPGQVLDQLRDGWTFQSIASGYGVSGRWNDPWYGQKVQDYLDAYKATGKGALEAASFSDVNGTSNGTMNGGVPAGMMSNDIVQTAEASGQFTTFVKLLHRARLTATLEGPGPFTVFAPTDSAFAKIPSDQLRDLIHNRAELRQVLEFHVIPARISAADAMAMTTPTSPATLEGDPLQVTTSNGMVMINNATVTTPDIQASNGVIHAIDTVLLPPSIQLTSTPTVQMPMPGTASAPGEDQKTPTPNQVNGTGPNLNSANPQPESVTPGTALAPGQDSKTATPNSVYGTAPAGSVPSQAPGTQNVTPNAASPAPATVPDMGTTNSAQPSATMPLPPVTASPTPDQSTTTTPAPDSRAVAPAPGSSTVSPAPSVAPSNGSTTPAPSNPTMAPGQGTMNTGASSSNLP